MYISNFATSNEGYIKNWPREADLYGWIIQLRTGGNLGSHMHKLGWLSGSLYLKNEKINGSNEGDIIFSLDGADYPTDNKTFPSKAFEVETGDIILFPSSLFHKTTPFKRSTSRITLAFDIKPGYN